MFFSSFPFSSSPSFFSSFVLVDLFVSCLEFELFDGADVLLALALAGATGVDALLALVLVGVADADVLLELVLVGAVGADVLPALVLVGAAGADSLPVFVVLLLLLVLVLVLVLVLDPDFLASSFFTFLLDDVSSDLFEFFSLTKE